MLPDWGHPLDIDGTTGFAADGRVLVLPEALVLARDPDGLPDFRLSAVRPVLPREGDRGHGRLEMGLALVSRRATADGRVAAAPALRGWLWLAALFVVSWCVSSTGLWLWWRRRRVWDKARPKPRAR